mmetsp:Transcript_68204/g.134737  ORF Transcript_68204/g.134737 Transcript_68204/m.134737 type:complete len:588 (-) Transcript_68204:14-1777(-)
MSCWHLCICWLPLVISAIDRPCSVCHPSVGAPASEVDVGAPASEVDFLIVGAGPAGLQWALLLESANVTSYLVLEKGFGAGSFFRTYPRARRLISNNKCRSGKGKSKDFGFRHDWNSLLGTNRSLCDLTNEFYTSANYLVEYLEEVAVGLRIEYNATVLGTSRHNGRHVVHLVDGRAFSCQHLVVATGFAPEPLPKAHWTRAKELFTYQTFPDLDANGKAPFCDNREVYIIGNGNAAFETANMLASCASAVHMFMRRPPRFSALTHYVGDVRMKSFEIADRYLLKSLDSLLVVEDWMDGAAPAAMSKEFGAVIIFSGGFTGRSPRLEDVSEQYRLPLVGSMNSSAKSKFPLTATFFSDPEVENKWYAGNLMHGRDYRSGAGGFIHGFRYLINAQVNFILAKHYERPYPSLHLADDASLKSHVNSRFQNSSALYQMHGHMRDIVVRHPSGSGYLYVEQIPRYWVHESLALLGVQQRPACHMEVGFDYGHTSEVPGPWDFSLMFSEEREDRNPPLFLHPVMVAVDASSAQTHFHGGEDFRASWTDPEEVRRNLEALEACMKVCLTGAASEASECTSADHCQTNSVTKHS